MEQRSTTVCVILANILILFLSADKSVVHPHVCPASCTVKFTMNIVDLTLWQTNKQIMP